MNVARNFKIAASTWLDARKAEVEAIAAESFARQARMAAEKRRLLIEADLATFVGGNLPERVVVIGDRAVLVKFMSSWPAPHASFSDMELES